MPRTEDPTITVGALRQALSAYKDSDELSFSGLTYYRVKLRGPALAQIEFDEQVYRDDEGRVVVQNPG
jgi:hypothetical protein